jgi:Histidine kinase-, DNA gyrase B-, and HSP90-like ATPase
MTVDDDLVSPPEDPNRVEAGAEKRFFIDMLTRDIELIPAIADLVDNSVDGARGMAVDPADLNGYYVHIEAVADRFVIDDNCGGIDIDTARKYAFRFGRATHHPGLRGSVGQFGIGMKRALFKLGKKFVVESVYVRGEANNSFRLEVDVDEWAEREKDWSFALNDLVEHGSALAQSAGTKITVTPLLGGVSLDLADAAQLHRLRNELAVRHSQTIAAGMLITVNGVTLRADLPKLQSSETFKPIAREFDVRPPAGGEVHVTLYAGTRQPVTKVDNEDDADEFRANSDGGWYVFCNGRLLLAGDQTSTTGWGGFDGGAAYHPQYRNVYGYVFMEAEDPSLLPWNTAKTALDRDSDVYRQVLEQMRSALIAVQRVVNSAKAEPVSDEDSPLRAAINKSRDVALSAVMRSSTFVAPTPTKRVSSPSTTVRIMWAEDRKRYEALAKILGGETAAEVGRRAFNYAYRKEVK